MHAPSKTFSLPNEYVLYPAKLTSIPYHNLLSVMKLLVFLKFAESMRKNGFNMACSYSKDRLMNSRNHTQAWMYGWYS